MFNLFVGVGVNPSILLRVVGTPSRLQVIKQFAVRPFSAFWGCYGCFVKRGGAWVWEGFWAISKSSAKNKRLRLFTNTYQRALFSSIDSGQTKIYAGTSPESPIESPRGQFRTGGTSSCPSFPLIQAGAWLPRILHGTGVFTYISHTCKPNVGKYPSPMESKGLILS